MAKLKVLLIAPTYIDDPNTMYFPIGMAYLASYISSKDFYCDGLNMNNTGYQLGLVDLNKKLQETEFDVIGIGALTVAFAQIEKLVKYIRKLSNAKIIIGGGVTSCESELVMQEIKPDYMAISEAELIFEEILLHIYDPNKHSLPKGTWYCGEAGKIISNNESYAISDLDTLPFPNYKLMGIEGYINLQSDDSWDYHRTDMMVGKSVPISASRSCPFRCTFCHHAGMGTYRKHSIDYAINFIKKILEDHPLVTHIEIYDELFSANKKRVIEFCKLLKPLNITFFCQLRVDQIDENLLNCMKEAGCTEISFGIESGSQKVIDSMNKKITIEQTENALRLTRKAKILVQGNFLFGDPAETKDTIKESIEFQERNQLFFSDWSMVLPYPGTILHKIALEKGMIKDRVQFMKDIADTSKYLWNSPINLTQFDDDTYINIYSDLRQVNDMNHRKVRSKIINQKCLDDRHSSMLIECPNCSETNQYDKLPYPFNYNSTLELDRGSFFGFLGINLVCPDCRQKHHLISNDIPHVNKVFEKFNAKLENFTKFNDKDIVLMPAMDRHFHAVSEYLNINEIKPYAVLDSRDYRVDKEFFGKRIEKLSDENIKKIKDKKFIILPWVEYKQTYEQLLKNGVEKQNILMWNDYL